MLHPHKAPGDSPARGSLSISLPISPPLRRKASNMNDNHSPEKNSADQKSIPAHITRQKIVGDPASPIDPGPAPVSAIPPDRRQEIWSRARSISRNLTAIREILDRCPEPLTQDDRNALASIQAVYARMSFVQSMYARNPDTRRNRFVGH